MKKSPTHPKASRELRRRLREMDTQEENFSENFLEGFHDKVMSRIEKAEIQQPELQEDPVRASLAKALNFLPLIL